MAEWKLHPKWQRYYRDFEDSTGELYLVFIRDFTEQHFLQDVGVSGTVKPGPKLQFPGRILSWQPVPQILGT